MFSSGYSAVMSISRSKLLVSLLSYPVDSFSLQSVFRLLFLVVFYFRLDQQFKHLVHLFLIEFGRKAGRYLFCRLGGGFFAVAFFFFLLCVRVCFVYIFNRFHRIFDKVFGQHFSIMSEQGSAIIKYWDFSENRLSVLPVGRF